MNLSFYEIYSKSPRVFIHVIILGFLNFYQISFIERIVKEIR